MKHVQDGDLSSLGIIYERYKHNLYSFFYRMSSDQSISEDLLHNVFERVLKYKDNFRGEGAFKYWIYHIARNVYADYGRKKGKLKTTELYDAKDSINNESPEKIALQSETSQRIHQALLCLSEEDRKVIILSKMHGFKYREISTLMGLTENAIKIKVFRGLKKLKDEITRQKII